ncbi:MULTISPECIES: DUF1800 family protein [Crateriforma]|uniref:DUF1800 domain-containing protein n=1 Tax=Crateriforma conspicua TaxID=2527996 RepID=A0A5C6FNT6_9PLAN|nr:MULTISPECIES: DUF1800 family protein [Crateriforma]TWU62882.1 hypothetical protein V7x_46190 [Crateriforma conspicua]
MAMRLGVRCAILLAAVMSCFHGTSARGGDFEVFSRNEMIDVMVRVRATQFLQRATFGPTQDEIDAMTMRMRQIGVTAAAEEWIDQQFALEPTSHVATARAMMAADGWAENEDGVNITRYRDHAWWHIAITAPDQLKQRIAWALIQICVISNQGAGFNNRGLDNNQNADWLGLSNYYDMLLENSDDTYREVLGDVTFSPVMGTYLSHLRNKKGDPSKGVFPDENYAREIMQLFSIGLYEMDSDGQLKVDAEGNDIPTYDNETIKAFARLFTGLTFAGSRTINNGRRDLHNPMMMFNDSHDQDPKTLLNGVTLPANPNGIADINAGLDNLYAHPNVAPFISRLLIQRLVRSNPSRAYLGRVAAVFNDNGQGVKGDMKAVIKAILLDRECWNSIRVSRSRRPVRIIVRPTGTERSRLAEPVVMYAGFLRRFSSPEPDGWYRLPALNYNWVQAPYRSPSVFNFYLPDFQPAGPITAYQASSRIPNGSIYAPEFQLFDAVVANRMANRIRGDIADANADYTAVNNQKAGRHDVDLPMDFSVEETLGEDPMALAKHLDMTLCAGTMTNEFREALVDALQQETNVQQRTRGAILSVLMSPAGMIVE